MVAARIGLILISLLSFASLNACDEIKPPIVIGAKAFAEQRIIAEIVAQSLRARDIPVQVDQLPRDSLDAVGALWVGDIDLYVEYTGSALSLIGHPPIHDVDESITTARAQLAPFDLTMGPLLGFRNDYAVLVRPGAAIATVSNKISDLADLKKSLKIGMTIDFRKRPLDGYEAFVRRYGMRAEAALVVPSSPEGKDNLYSALLNEEVDLAIGFTSDPEILDFGLLALADDKEFFPAYASAPLTRASLLKQRPALKKAFADLAGIVSTMEMRRMVAKVVNLGMDPFTIAASFMDPKIAPTTAPGERRPMPIALGSLDALAGQSAEVILAFRKAFPGRHIDAKRASDPLALLLEGKVRYALASGPEFFRLPEKGSHLREIRGHVNALAPVGFDAMHLLVKTEGGQMNLRDGVRLGVGASSGITARTAIFVQAGLDGADVALVTSAINGVDAFRAQAEEVLAGVLDGLLLMAEPGHPLVAELINNGLKLAPIDDWGKYGNRLAFPFLQPITIPAATYAGQPRPLASLGSQVVIAAARPDPAEAVGVVGPGSAAIGKTLPVGAGTVARIREALKVEVGLDPSIPVATAARQPPPASSARITPSPLGSLINLAVVVVLVLTLRLYLIKPKTERTEQ